MLRVFAVLATLPFAVMAQDWQPMTGAQITAALTARDITYQNATQRFYASGRTLYNAGQDSWGYWAVRGDQYCSQWPPGDGWDCYDMARAGNVLRFIGADDSVTDGMLSE
jgi:hypothetical protein